VGTETHSPFTAVGNPQMKTIHTYYFKFNYDWNGKTNWTGRTAVDSKNYLSSLSLVEEIIKREHPQATNIKNIRKV
jgi:hypothetical protein